MSKQKSRDTFTGKFGFIVACIGAAVGMGNIWRFPMLVSVYGGLTFILPYFLFVILVSKSGIVEEFALGRAAKAGPVGAFGWATAQRGNEKAGRIIGYIPVFGSLALAIGYSVVMGWIIKYMTMSFTGSLYSMGTDMDVIGGTFGVTADSWGCNGGIVAAVVLSFGIMSFGISKGIETANKVLMPLLFLLFVVLGIYIAFLPGSSNGYKYILTLNPAGLKDPKVWIYAFGQAFFSLCVAGNGSVIYGSYLGDSESIPVCARNVAIFDTMAALLAAFVILPAMATSGEQVSSGGPGLMFIYLVNVFNAMGSAGRVIGIIFFVMVFFAGLSSIINLYEAPVEFVESTFSAPRPVASAVMLAIGGACALCIQHITSDWMDVVSNYICPLGAMLAAIMFFWVIRKDVALSEVNKGSNTKLGNSFYFLGKYVFVTCAFLALVLGVILGGIG